MKQAGKASLVTILGVVAAAVVVGLFFVRVESPSVVASKFMSALAKGDVDGLTKWSYSDRDTAELKKQWEYSVNVAGPFYIFAWQIRGDQIADDNHASVRLEVVRDADKPDAYPENFALPMVRVKDTGWRVDIRNVSRQMYPALPR